MASGDEPPVETSHRPPCTIILIKLPSSGCYTPTPHAAATGQPQEPSLSTVILAAKSDKYARVLISRWCNSATGARSSRLRCSRQWHFYCKSTRGAGPALGNLCLTRALWCCRHLRHWGHLRTGRRGRCVCRSLARPSAIFLLAHLHLHNVLSLELPLPSGHR